MATLEQRVQTLEAGQTGQLAALPVVLPDDAPAAEIERLRAQGIEVFTMTHAVERFAP